MPNLKYLINKSKESIEEDGFGGFVKKSIRYATGVRNPIRSGSGNEYKDVLFINGCTLPHPSRYRVDHQMEQLLANGYTSDSVFYEDLELELEKKYRTFVFFRCPITDKVKKFIEKAKSQNKTVFYDIDDLVFDKKYTSTIKYINTMSESELNLYYDGVKRMGDTLKLCDYAITTTERLAKELKKYVKKVYINRNVASEEMVKLSIKASKNVEKDNQKIVIGYLSGSITHNADFELVLPAIKRIMKKYNNVYLKVVGLLDVPTKLNEFKDRIISEPFVSWKKLPEIIASLDINLAPLEDSIFNEAKSENKWVEAALCKVVTVASNIGAFKVINDNVDGFLCENTDEWFKVLDKLIMNHELREKVGTNAFKRVTKDCVTTYTGYGLAKFIKDNISKSVAFILPTTNISGGVNVVVKHCNILRDNGYQVFIINCNKNSNNIINSDGEVEVISKSEITINAKIDVMVASLWSTLEYVMEYPKVIHRKYLVQNFETDFMKYGDKNKLIANATYSFDNVEYITISKWCKEWLEKKYGRNVKYVRNGIKIENFDVSERDFSKKIRILVEGNSDDYYKNVDESFKIVDKLDKEKFEIQFLSYQGEPKKWYYVDKFLHKVPHDKIGSVYADADILIKSSILESFSYPPLEMMATGGISVVVPNDGNIEYLKDEYNCLFYEQGNIEDAVLKINEICSNEKLRKKIIKNGLDTAKKRDWKYLEKEIVNIYMGD